VGVLGWTCATGAKKLVGDGRALADAEGVRDGLGVGFRDGLDGLGDGLDGLGVGVAVGVPDGVGVGVAVAVGVADGVGVAVAVGVADGDGDAVAVVGVTAGEPDDDGVAEDAVPGDGVAEEAARGDGVVEGEGLEDGAVEDWAAEAVAVDEPETSTASPRRTTATVEILAAVPGSTLACTPPVLAWRTTAVPAPGAQARVAAAQAVKAPMTVSALRPAPADICPPCLDYPDIQCEQYSNRTYLIPNRGDVHTGGMRSSWRYRVRSAGVATDDGRP
jgi:hypothetical protein